MVRLRPYKPSDGVYLIRWMQEEKSFYEWCAGIFQYPLSMKQLEEYYHRYEQDEAAMIMTALDENGEPLGHFMMREIDWNSGSARIGFVAVSSYRRGRGYGQEMIRMAVKYAFEILGLQRVTLGVYEHNKRAHACYQKVGFVDNYYIENAFKYKEEHWGAIEMYIEK